ncbi:DUF3301 domain-containing protein [Arenimonas composti]|uniref:DUF3301 domain-containing protein n=1 Tax=Arenimonas composti TR7-09 = DSM 18010 TaxID=1121013 RepID=A0A091BK16_9GAMM|nr:DUF3301 domain-containing protein [Arenimonas composti]KFN51144.1 hypothetical protein P873_04395 [Arenimonas composti TR7-09 = DSM 18010]
MLTELLTMLGATALVAFWFAGRAAAEAAVQHGRDACARAGVQWLDQSVHLVAMRLRRGADGWLAVERHYGFEFSLDGDDRHAGRIVMQGRRLHALLGPAPRAEVT